MTPLTGGELPQLAAPIPGPASRALAGRLARVESRNITVLDPPPIFWTEARGSAVRDADGNVYIDLTAGFGVANAGHGNPDVAAAIAEQSARLAHGMGDVFPPEPKVRLLERLAGIAPGDLGISILASSGAEAVEAALKTAVLRTRRTGILAFVGAYHGLTYGALATTWRDDFRAPFTRQLFGGVRFVPYPGAGSPVEHALALVRQSIDDAEAGEHPIGAVIIEPILGRGGIVVPPPGFLAGLRALCDGVRTLLVFDEIYTGCGRTGTWFCCEHEGVTPDLLVVGKGLTGSIPLSAAIGTPDAMQGWPPSHGEAIHTSTFLGNPVACAAALAQLGFVEEHGLLQRAAVLGERIHARAVKWQEKYSFVGAPRGRGLLQGIPLQGDRRALDIAERCLQRGVLILAEGPQANVLALTPPAVITDLQLGTALDILESCIAESET